MANVVLPNNPYQMGGNVNEAVWRLTRAMKKAGWLVVASSDGVTKIAPATNSSDSWGTGADPALDTYPTSFATAVPWIVMRGPSTIKIPITTLPTVEPTRGERVTQGSAEGEFLGYVFDATSSSGWMVVVPRVGTFNSSDTITGFVSAATFTPGGTIVTYVREFMFALTSTTSNTIDHQIFYVCADVVNESAQLYSSLAATVGCTAVIAPGCAASGTNQFPALGIAVRGTSGSTVAGSANPIGTGSSGMAYGNYHVGCANAIAGTGVTPDGSFYLAGNINTSTTGIAGFGYFRVDDGDPGDCDPYVALMMSGSSTLNSWSRLSNVGNTATNYSFGATNLIASNIPVFLGYQARGCPFTMRDIPAPYVGAMYNGQPGNLMTVNFPSTVRALNHPAALPPLSKENLMIWTPGTSNNPPVFKHYKGRARWLVLMSKGNQYDTFDNKKFICTSTVAFSTPAVALGPWDGITTPTI